MAEAAVILRVAEPLRFFLAPHRRAGPVVVRAGPTDSLGHLVESVGVPLPEVGRLLVAGRPADSRHRAGARDVVDVLPVLRPQTTPTDPPRFLLDVHLGALARRLRLLGLDAAYDNDATDDDLVRRAAAERRVLLTQDRGLLKRRAVLAGAYVRGQRPDDQTHDVLDRFAPRLAPWTRCPTCNGRVEPVPRSAVEGVLREGTRRTQDRFSRCAACGQLYWHGAHARRLDALVAAARAQLEGRTG
jgi:hypothetical protein